MSVRLLGVNSLAADLMYGRSIPESCRIIEKREGRETDRIALQDASMCRIASFHVVTHE